MICWKVNRYWLGKEVCKAGSTSRPKLKVHKEHRGGCLELMMRNSESWENWKVYIFRPPYGALHHPYCFDIGLALTAGQG